eukprot:995549-Amphidinium_carterae.1
MVWEPSTSRHVPTQSTIQAPFGLHIFGCYTSPQESRARQMESDNGGIETLLVICRFVLHACANIQ